MESSDGVVSEAMVLTEEEGGVEEEKDGEEEEVKGYEVQKWVALSGDVAW